MRGGWSGRGGAWWVEWEGRCMMGGVGGTVHDGWVRGKEEEKVGRKVGGRVSGRVGEIV